jgi:mono/diheme cytochrome c family protein
MNHSPPAPSRRRHSAASLLALGCLLAATAAGAATAPELLAGYTAQAGAPSVSARGQQFFTTSHGRDWSCSSCHGPLPVQSGKHAATGQAIGALAPAFNPGRFTDPAKAEKWFRRNCNDVVGRECTAAEKADVLGWLLTLKP